MSRLDEVEQTIKSILYCAENFRVESNSLQHQIRTLAAEVDARDEVIRRLLAMLEPGPEPNCMDPEYNPSKRVSIYDVVRMWYEHRSAIHARACEIAGRTE